MVAENPVVRQIDDYGHEDVTCLCHEEDMVKAMNTAPSIKLIERSSAAPKVNDNRRLERAARKLSG